MKSIAWLVGLVLRSTVDGASTSRIKDLSVPHDDRERGATCDTDRRVSRLCGRAAFMLLALCMAARVEAIEPFQEYRKRVESSQNIAVLKDGLFGDSVNLYNGQTSFANVDIDLPGNNALPVQLSRRFTVQIMPQGSGGGWDTSLGGAGGWDVDVPYISGTFGPVAGWKDSRCSSNWVPTVATNFQLTEIWQGNSVHVPGGGDRTMLGVDPQAPTPQDGRQHRITTTERDVFSCTPMKRGLGGEGFVMQTTSGVSYYFDMAVQRSAGQMTRSLNSYMVATTARMRVYLLASKAVDRFGNTVQWEYNEAGNPTRIWSSDGREIVLNYANGQLVSATAAGRAWTYQYTEVEGQTRLSAVVLPDASRWAFEYSNALRPVDQSWDGNSDPRCGVQPPELPATFTLTVTHPSNAVGAFSFANKRHYRSGVHVSECLVRLAPPGGEEVGQYWVLGTPFFFDVMSLEQKAISGPGISTHAWRYDYGVAPQSLWGSPDTAATYPCATCAREKVVTVTGPDGVRNRYRYGFMYALNEGRVLGVDTIDPSGAVERSERSDYLAEAEVAGQAFHGRFGLIRNGDDPSTAAVRPVVRKTIVQDAVTFTSQVEDGCGGAAVYCLDKFARATREARSSSLGSKIDTTEYYDDEATWVLGQVARTTTNGIETSRTSYDAETDLPVRVFENNRLQQVFSYNADGTFATMSDGRDGSGFDTTVHLSDWKRGTPQIIAYPATPEAPNGTELTAKVNDDGTIAWVIDEADSKTCYEYDAAGRLSGIIYPTDAANTCGTQPRARTDLSFAPVSSAEYGLAGGHWKRTISTGDARQVLYLDAFWRPVLEEKFDADDIAGTRSVVARRYDLGGQVAFESYPVASTTGAQDPSLKGTYRTYDTLDRVTRVEQDSELGQRTATVTRYLDGFRQEVVNPRGQTTTTSFTAYDQPMTDLPKLVSHPEGAFTEIVRNSLGKPTVLRRRNADGSKVLDRRYVYHPTYQTLCKTIEPETGSTVVDYDAAGNLLWSASGLELPSPTSCNLTEASASGRRSNRVYDARNRLTSLAFPDGRGNLAYTYDAVGSVRSVVANNDGIGANAVRTTYTRDRRGLLRREVVQIGSAPGTPVDYQYDANGYLVSQAYADMVVDYAPNALGQSTRAGAFATGAKYFPNGALRQFTYGNGVVHQLTQNARGLPARSLDQYGSLKILDDAYAYDANGNVMCIDDSATGTNSRGDRTMTYDGLDRLKRAQSIMFGTTTSSAAGYTYDIFDNLTGVIVNSTPSIPGRDWSYFYDGNWRLTNVLNRTTGGTVVGLGYDDQGNMTQKSVSGRDNLQFDFDFGNRLRKVSRATSSGLETVSTYLYDGLGRRVSDQNTAAAGGPAGAKLSQYSEAGQLLQATDNRTGTSSGYVYLGGSLVTIRERTGAPGSYVYANKYQHTDALGSPVAVTDSARSVVERNEYEPYGKVLKPAVPKDGPGYTGHVFDSATGMNYMQQRYYDPTVGMFLSVDPVTAYEKPGQNFNRFWYASNNPYRFTDPDGREVTVKVERDTYTKSSISSTVTVSSDLVSDTFEGYALEDRNAGSLGNKDPIAAGTYDAFVRTDGSKGFRLELEDVDNFSYVQIHVGNSTDDLTGCFAAGESRSENFVSKSRSAMGQIQSIVEADGSGNIKVEVTGSPNPVAAPIPVDKSLQGKEFP